MELQNRAARTWGANPEFVRSVRSVCHARRLCIALVAIVLSVATACGEARRIVGFDATSTCVRCHGGLDNDTGAPPYDLHGRYASDAVGAHTAHVAAGVRCASCHVDPREVPSTPTHWNGVPDVVFGAFADPNGAATYDRTSHTCSNVYCHHPFAPDPGSASTPSWNGGAAGSGCGACHSGPGMIHGGGPDIADCTVCHSTTVDGTGEIVPGGTHFDGVFQGGGYHHDGSWASTTENGTTPHGLAATYRNRAAYPDGLAACKRCHGSSLDAPSMAGTPPCDGCHADGTAAWRTDCTFCHGDATRAQLVLRAAPPRDVSGNSASAKIGAHQVHLQGDSANAPVISNGVACDDCHGGTTRSLPGATTPLHFDGTTDGTTEVTPKQPGQTAAAGRYDPLTGACTETYCHGNLPRNPKLGNAPSWTATSGQTNCGACHAANGTYCGIADVGLCSDATSGLHDKHRCARCHGNGSVNPFATKVGCFACHPGYQRQLGPPTTTAIILPRINLEYHVDGTVDVAGATSGLFNYFALTLDYVPPSVDVAASCTTNCHTDIVSGHFDAPTGSVNW